MPHDWDTQKRAFRDPSGNYISRRELKAKIDKLTAYISKQAGRIAARFDAGTITAVQFNDEMRELLKAGHIVAASVGRGGRARMTAADWGKVGSKIKWQYSFLEKFTRKLTSGTLSKANTANRAKSYVSSIYISFANAAQVAQTEFTGDSNPKGEMLVRLITNSEEGCPECAADEDAGWMPVGEMGELGTRICGDFCKCELIFEDEI